MNPLLAVIVFAMCVAYPPVILAFGLVLGVNLAIGFAVEQWV